MHGPPPWIFFWKEKTKKKKKDYHTSAIGVNKLWYHSIVFTSSSFFYIGYQVILLEKDVLVCTKYEHIEHQISTELVIVGEECKEVTNSKTEL